MTPLSIENLNHHSHAALALAFTAGILATLSCLILPVIWHCPSNPILGPMVQMRKKRSRIEQAGGLGAFELKDHYGLEHQVLNLDFRPETMWMNVGFWRNNPQSLPEACEALLEELLRAAGLLDHDHPFSVLQVGCGCAETARYMRRRFPRTFEAYIGVTLNGCQADYAAKQLALDAEIRDEKKETQENHIYCADAADPASWPDSLHEILKQRLNTHEERKSLCVQSQPYSRPRPRSLWLLALDTLYHFSPLCIPLLTHASSLDASLMATDIILADNISLLDRIMLRFVFSSLRVPACNLLTRAEYFRMLGRCGYDEARIEMLDITEHCFEGFDAFTKAHMQRWESMGGSRVISRPVRMMGAVMGWWARRGTVREVIVVARK
ncbi:hypothetical protein BDW74DRAFT_181477 [Aspergillus multicolor]|uniref:SAM-dependent methyltransferase n=1 Tax=Aspergillus multicolor TaxID=41759 RepID=UPI003CCE38F8